MRTVLARRVLPVVTVLATLLGVGSALSMAPANAANVGAGVFNGTAALPQFPCAVAVCAGGAFNGTFTGVVAGTSGVANCATGCTMTAGFSYTETCSGAGYPPIGTADGNFNVASSTPFAGKFSWTRVGLTSIIVLRNINGGTGPADGAAVALFVPNNPAPPHSCAATGPVPGPGPQSALVVGVAAGTDAL